MGIVARPVGDFINGTVADGDQVDQDFNAIYNEFNGNVDNNNIKTGAAIVGTKIAASPSGIPTDRINDAAITTAKIADDAVDSVKLRDDAVTDANRAVTRNHIRDAAINIAKLNVLTHSTGDWPIIAAGSTQELDTGLVSGNTLPLAIYHVTNDPAIEALVITLRKAATWIIAAYNPTGSGIDMGANEIKFDYIASA